MKRPPLDKMSDPASGDPRPVKVDPRIMKAAKEALLPGQRIVVVSATEVHLVNEETS